MTIAPHLDLGPNAEYMLRLRYLAESEEPIDLFRRVARNVASAEAVFDPAADVDAWAERFFGVMTGWEFLPNAPTLLGAGRPLQQLHACFVLPVGDSIDAIFETLRMAAIVHSNGGGTGFSFGSLRGRGAAIATGGVSTGAVSFMRLFDAETEVIKHGGTGWGANMGVLPARHPDVREFVCAKDGSALRNFNLSVAADDAWMASALAGTDAEAAALLDLIASRAWASGDPGLLFADRIERDNPVPALGRLEATNPCGEAPLLPFEACCLGGLNVSRFVGADGDIDWPRLRATAALALRMMDDVIEVSRYPLPEIAEATRRTRKVGIGVMGFADLLVALGIPYGSSRSEDLARRLMREIRDATRAASIELGAERGSFPAFARSLAAGDVATLRNATTTSNAPNSTIGAIAGCSPGIEPLFALSSTRHLASGDTLTEVNAAFERAAREGGFLADDLLAHVHACGRVAGRTDVPEDVRDLFVTAHDLPFDAHVRVQAAFQESTDLGISKTINLPHDATPIDVRDAYALAWERGCKGVTVFRDGCLDEQFIATGARSAPPTNPSRSPAEPDSGSNPTHIDRIEPLFPAEQPASASDGACEVCA